MANGSYRTSELPQAANMAPSDRVVILYNAAANPSVGNGSPSTRTIPLTKLIDAGMAEVFTDISASNTFSIGNSISNVFVNSSSVIISNFTGTTFSVNTEGVVTSNGYGLTSIQGNNINGLATIAISGSYNDLNNIPSFAVSAYLDTSNASNINTGTLGVGVTLPAPSYDALTVGNSTSNVVLNSTSISVGVSNSTANGVDITNNSIQVGNDTVYTVITANSVQIGNGTVYMNSSVISIGNSTVNVAQINSSSISVGNSTVSAVLSTTGHTIGNVGSTTGAVTITNNYIYVGNSSINTYMNAYAFYAGNTNYYATVQPVQLYTSGPTSQSSIQPSSMQVTNGSVFVGIANSTANLVAINSTSLSVGNGSINVSINATTFSGTSLTANNATNLGGVAAATYVNTSGAYVSTGSLTFGNSTVNNAINSSVITLGNSSVNFFVNSTSATLDSGIFTVGNSTVNVAANQTSLAVGVINSTAIGSLLTNTYLTIGNSSVNTYLDDQSGLITGNTTVNTTVNSTIISVNGSLIVGNSVSGFLANSTSKSLGNSTVNVVFNSTSMSVGAVNSTAVGISVANNLITIGNSSVNVTANSTTFSGTSLTANNATNLGGVAAATYVNTSGSYVITGTHTYGNATVNSFINSTAHFIGAINSTASGLVANMTVLSIGNSSVNVTANSTTFSGTSLTANNATNLGGVAAATYVQTGSFNVVNTSGNGSFNLPGGWHMAFGLVTSNSLGGLAVTFANAFTQNAYSVTATITDTGTSFAATVVDRVHIGTVTKTGFTLWTGNSSANAGAANVYFQAIGF